MIDYKDKEFRKSIVKAINNDKLIIFVGAGISRLCGLPSWDEAANHLLAYCVSHCRNFTYANKERIIANVKDAKEKITIGYYLLKKEDDSDALYQTWLKNEFSLDASSKDKNFSRKQVRMRSLIRGLSSIVFSTNVDLLLDKDIPYENRFFTKEQLQNICIKEKTDQQIWHLHGSLDRSRDIVFTTRQYLERYADPRFRDNLYNLLKRGEYTILFIGYGLSELQLLDFLVNAKGDGTRMFLLQPYFSDDGPLYEAEAPYYMDYGITLIKYPKDHGYNELFQVLADLKKEVNDSSSKTTEIYSNLEKVLREKPTESAESYIKRNFDCLTDDLKSNLMFSLRGKNDYSSQWLFFLYKQEEYSYLFDAFNDLPNSSSDDKEPFNIKNLRLLLNEFAEKKSEDLFSISKEKSKQLFIGEFIPHIKQECTSLVVLLLQNSSSFKDSKTVLIPCALALSGNGFSGHYVNEVVAEFQKDTFTNQEKIEISSAIADHIKDCYFYYDDIIHLFDTIDWSNNKNRFNELQVKYRKIEPDLASELLEEYKKKYPVNKNR